jgi:hypothetical protein
LGGCVRPLKAKISISVLYKKFSIVHNIMLNQLTVSSSFYFLYEVIFVTAVVF